MNAQQAAMVKAAMENGKKMQAQYAGANMDVTGKTGTEILALVAQGNQGLMMKFISDSQLYINDPEAVHRNIPLFMKQDFNMFGILWHKVAMNKPSVLAPHIQFFVDKMVSNIQTATLTIQILDGIAKENPNLVQPYLLQVGKLVENAQSGALLYAKVVSKMAYCTHIKNAPDYAFGILIDMLRKPGQDNYTPAVILGEVSNLMTMVSDKQIVRDALPIIANHRSASELMYISIVDYANDRSLEKVSSKVDALEKRVNELNADVS
jgi:hypothetical protein